MVLIIEITINLGKQNGIGLYYVATGELKVGEWLDGKRMKWYDEAEVEKLKQEGKIKEENLRKAAK